MTDFTAFLKQQVTEHGSSDRNSTLCSRAYELLLLVLTIRLAITVTWFDIISAHKTDGFLFNNIA